MSKDKARDYMSDSVLTRDQINLPNHCLGHRDQINLPNNCLGHRDQINLPNNCLGHRDQINLPNHCLGHRDQINLPNHCLGHRDQINLPNNCLGHKDQINLPNNCLGHRDQINLPNNCLGHRDQINLPNNCLGHRDQINLPNNCLGHRDQINSSDTQFGHTWPQRQSPAEGAACPNKMARFVKSGSWPLASSTESSSDGAKYKSQKPSQVSSKTHDKTSLIDWPLASSTESSSDRNTCCDKHQTELLKIHSSRISCDKSRRYLRRRSKSEPFDFCYRTPLDKSRTDVPKRWMWSEPLASSTEISLDLFNISQWQINEDQIERCRPFYGEVNDNRNESKRSSTDDMTDIVFAVLHPCSGLMVKDRCWLKCLIPNAIVGKELTHWLLKKVGGIVSLMDAEVYAQEMLNRGFLRSPLSYMTKFVPQWYYTVSLVIGQDVC